MQHNRGGEQKLYNQFGLFSLILFLSSIFLNAGSFENFKSTQAQAFIAYKDENDAAFGLYLKKQWKEYYSQHAKSLYEKQKPEKVAITRENELKSMGPKIHVVINNNDKKYLENIFLNKSIKKEINIDFFGSHLGFNIPETIKSAKFYPQNQSGIASFFDVVVSSNYEQLIKSIKDIKKNLVLNDWGIYLLVEKISKKCYTSPEEAKLFSWIVFNKLGYDVKVGLSNKHVVVMHYSKKVIYSTPNYKFKDKRFYVVSQYAKGRTGSVYTYKQSYPNATKALDLEMKILPNLEKDIRSKKVSFEQYGQTYTSTYKYNQNLIDFMSTYPQAEYETFFNAPLETITYNDLIKDLKKYIDGKKASIAMNFVLRFVQKAFAYQVDDKQFGREKVMFAEETLYYDKSDCEDRAVLFSYLIKNLFHVAVVGVKYKDHMSTALYIPMDGDVVKKGHKRYVIADPTYINANIGMSMPKYKSVRPDSFIVIKK